MTQHVQFEAFVLLADKGNFTVEWLETFLTKFKDEFTSEKLTLSTKSSPSFDKATYPARNSYVLTWPDNWQMHFHFTNAPHVIIESAEMAELFAKEYPDQAIIATCAQRIEIGSDPDDDMLHFNDFIYIKKRSQKFHTLIFGKPQVGAFKSIRRRGIGGKQISQHKSYANAHAIIRCLISEVMYGNQDNRSTNSLCQPRLYCRATNTRSEIILTKNNVPVARLMLAEKPITYHSDRVFDQGKGDFVISDDFDDPLPDEFWLGDEATDPLYKKD